MRFNDFTQRVDNRRNQSVAVGVVVLKIELRTVRVEHLGQASGRIIIGVRTESAYRIGNTRTQTRIAGVGVVERKNATRSIGYAGNSILIRGIDVNGYGVPVQVDYRN